MPKSNFQQRTAATFLERSQIARAPAAVELFQLMHEKRSNLCLAADVHEPKAILSLAKQCSEEIAMLKTHADAISNYSPALAGELSDLARDRSFLLFEDKKFADIGTTVKAQYSGGVHKIADWAHLVTVHSVPGQGVLEGLFEVARPKMERGQIRGAILIAQMSSKGNLATGEYTKKTVEMGKKFPGFCAGFIGTGSAPSELKKLAQIAPPQFAILTPGVNLSTSKGALSQQYSTPQKAITAGSDCIIVGSGIFKAPNPKRAAQEYRKAAWEQLEKRTK